MNDEQWRAAWRLCESLSSLPDSQRQAALAAHSDPEIAGAALSVMQRAEEIATAESLEPSRPIGRYVLGAIVGRGGMGLVYAAEDLELGRKVALKFVLRRVSFAEASTDLFIQEAKAASALNHPNIITVYEIVRSEQGLAIAMELVDGVSLRQLGRLPLRTALRYAKQIAEALAAAHGLGIIHRDIKPENIMVRRDGYVKLLDFGLARVAPEESDALQSGPAGTWRYMSPEQMRGERLTPASDIFSFGLVLCEMCAGEHAFPADSPPSEPEAIAASTPRLSSQNSRLPPALDRLISTMLDQRAELRPAASEVARLIEQLLESEAAIKERKRARRWLIAAVAFLLCLRGTIILWQRLSTHGEPVLTQITSNDTENRVTAAAISPDGLSIAYADPDGIFLRDISSSATRSLPSPPHFRVVNIAWLRGTGNLLLSGFDTSTLSPALWTATEGQSQAVLFRQDADNGAASPDGAQVAFTTNKGSEIWLEGADGKDVRRLIAGSSDDIFSVLFWSAGGKRLSFQRRRYHPLPAEPKSPAEFEGIYQYTYESADSASGRILVARVGSAIKSACALPDGRVFFTRWGLPDDRWTDNIWEMRTANATGAVLAPPRQITHLRKSSQAFGLTASADGKRMTAIIESDEADVYVGDLDEAAPLSEPKTQTADDAGPRLVNSRRLTLNSKTDYPHAWTPDSRFVIFESDRGGRFDLFRQAVDARVPETIVAGPLDKVMAQVTPDGRWLLYSTGDLWKHWALMRIPLGGGSAVKLLDLSGVDTQYRCPLPGGAASCVLREDKGHREFIFYELDPLKGKGRELGRTNWLPSFLEDWDVSPDGSTVAMPYHDVRRGKIRLVPLAPGGAEKELIVQGAGALRSVVWAVGGRGWFAAAETQAGDQLIFIDAAGRARLLRETTNRTWAVPSPDGRHLAFVDDGVDSNVWTIERF